MSDQPTSAGDQQAATVTTASRPIRTATGTGAQGQPPPDGDYFEAQPADGVESR
ncbi:hypothetical protein ACIBK9_11765 [Nonomuraea sp. NPDC050227]|uniref:hypothetical protein n=1 Tax=Nonomuraea sp. NPDC050227 TaxID=3364360 RepID=UPI0037931729